MIYTYELSVQVKKFLKGETEAFEKIFVMTADDVYFHVSMVIADPEEAEKNDHKDLQRSLYAVRKT